MPNFRQHWKDVDRMLDERRDRDTFAEVSVKAAEASQGRQDRSAFIQTTVTAKETGGRLRALIRRLRGDKS